MVKFPCKYNAVRHSICGKWKITVSPGNMLETDRNKKYVVRSLWLSAEDVNTKKYWEGRSDLKIARKVSVHVPLFLSRFTPRPPLLPS